MRYQCSICHPDQPDVERLDKHMNRSEVVDMIAQYPWLEKLKSMEKMEHKNIHYSPSVDFENVSDKRGLEITAILEHEQPGFSLWYNRPVKTRPLFGLLPEKTKMQVVDKWGFSLDEALEYYKLFLDQQYDQLERRMKEK